MFGLGNVLGSFGTIPDILMGKDPKKALTDNMKAAAIVGAGMATGGTGFGTMGGSTAAGAGSSGGLLSSFGTTAQQIGNGLQMANQARGLLSSGPPSPTQAPPLPNGQGLLSSAMNMAQVGQNAGTSYLQQRRQARQINQAFMPMGRLF